MKHKFSLIGLNHRTKKQLSGFIDANQRTKKNIFVSLFRNMNQELLGSLSTSVGSLVPGCHPRCRYQHKGTEFLLEGEM